MTEIIAACVGLAALAGGVAVITKLVKFLKKLSDAIDDWQGEPDRPGVPGRPGVMQRLEKIEAQLKPNGGHSTRDVVNRVEQSTRRIEDTLVATLEAQRGDID
ncbi:hypothetical protein ACU635_53235 [[Actinomadura] parvosata]|uniref:hypothetical protein n=1 Tax=[Actinomadura] parvosata TaxID=1955412 RepID=UPI00406C60BB